MAPHVPSSGKRPFSGQVVRSPSAGDGVGRALRDVYGKDKRLPGIWDQYLQRLDDWSGE
ncbi:hypothetical protein QLH51_10635 [Sphingomonas sp. 2R-10]|uniref:hypothetical protein n=1 Tax=Sphingomonas sp. 2R-10 TaxID=3045148 RepID=UPI0013DD985C|nr:hypothetical protein [Sphingomonas sp. 2R-10]MDJ0277250.1 hypothetical protein [Sphingomonas sp. 2R-10]